MATTPSSNFKRTVTQQEQLIVEQKVSDILNVLNDVSPHVQSLMLELWRDKHTEFLMRGLWQLGPSFCVLDANRPWLCYWIFHSLALLGESIDPELENNAIAFLSRCQDVNGGYGGGPGQMPHLATTYAAVNSLITLGGERALSSINRDKMRMFLLQMKDPLGAFRMHDAGEIDVRACYTAVSVASVLNILDSELVHNVGNYVLSCQTHEGGIAGEPGSEAHGGYTFCGLAAMILINEADRLDLPGLIDWVAFRQGDLVCGFQGRTNKLVDGCYSFWQGGVLALVQCLSSIVDKQLKLLYVGEGKQTVDIAYIPATFDLSDQEVSQDKSACQDDGISKSQFEDFGVSFLEGHNELGPLFNSSALQKYILLCSQVLEGGFKDKPGKPRDYYHTCYCLSGLSVCQYSWSEDPASPPSSNAVLGPYSNLLEPIHPLFNVIWDKYFDACDFFKKS